MNDLPFHDRDDMGIRVSSVDEDVAFGEAGSRLRARCRGDGREEERWLVGNESSGCEKDRRSSESGGQLSEKISGTAGRDVGTHE